MPGQDWAEPAQRAAYRTVQEALTNVSKHAPGAPVAVTVEASGDALHVTVSNGPPATSPAPLTCPPVAMAGRACENARAGWEATSTLAPHQQAASTLPNVRRHANSALERRDGSA